MKLINKKGMVFEKISIVDVIIILVIIAIGYYAITFLTTKDVNKISKQTIQYTFETEDVNENFAKQLQLEGNLYNSSKNYFVGKLIDYKVLPYEIIVPDLQNGVFIKQVVEDRFVVRMTIEANTDQDDYNIRINQENIKVGAMFPIKGKGFASYGYIVEIKEVVK
ncbi:MAG: Uncharacterized protein XD91_0350 [Clostridiales bacterium 38_11]|nr:MAG: Uncharacterized protein XD91_0350 [Clostridiales bacterium 38_11]HBH12735.1 hypothetical protein [Clostridiales bacterium]